MALVVSATMGGLKVLTNLRWKEVAPSLGRGALGTFLWGLFCFSVVGEVGVLLICKAGGRIWRETEIRVEACWT